MSNAPRVVLDTNIVVSALLWHGRPGRLFELAGDDEVALYYSPVLFTELRVAISRAKFAERLRAGGTTVAELLAAYAELATLVDPAPVTERYCRDPDDDHVIACAIAANVDLIVTGDDDLLILESVGSIRIQTVSATLALVDSGMA